MINPNTELPVILIYSDKYCDMVLKELREKKSDENLTND